MFCAFKSPKQTRGEQLVQHYSDWQTKTARENCHRSDIKILFKTAQFFHRCCFSLAFTTLFSICYKNIETLETFSKWTPCNFCDFEKKSGLFFEKSINFFKKRPKFWTFWKILLFQSHSTANLLHFDQKNFPFRKKTWRNLPLPMWHELNWQTSGKKIFHLRGRFAFIF